MDKPDETPPSSGQIMFVSRLKDPEQFEIDPSIVNAIPGDKRQTHHETFLSGGLNFYGPGAANTGHPSERDAHFLFSVSKSYAMRRIPKAIREKFVFLEKKGPVIPRYPSPRDFAPAS